MFFINILILLLSPFAYMYFFISSCFYRLKIKFLTWNLFAKNRDIRLIKKKYQNVHFYDDFKHTPITNYEEIENYLSEQIKYPDIVFKGSTDIVLRTSGTTKSSKLIPHPKKTLVDWIILFMTISIIIANMVWKTKNLILSRGVFYVTSASSTQIDKKSGSTEAGGNFVRSLWKFFGVYPIEILDIADKFTRFVLTFIFTVCKQPKFSFAYTPTTLFQFINFIEEHKSLLFGLVKDCDLSRIDGLKLTPDQLQYFQKQLPRLKNFLKESVTVNNICLRDFYPDWKIILCWNNIKFVNPNQKDLISSFFGNDIIFWDLGISATEYDILTIPIYPEKSVFNQFSKMIFEFCPYDGDSIDTSRVFLLDELKMGNQYSVIVTGLGLYRFNTNDIISLERRNWGLVELKFITRHNSSSIAGEKLTLHQVQSFYEKHIINDVNFFIVCVDHINMCYNLFLETSSQKSPKELSAAADVFEGFMIDANSRWLKISREGALKKTQVYFLPPDTFERFKQHRKAKQATFNDTQFKVKMLNDNVDDLAFFKALSTEIK